MGSRKAGKTHDASRAESRAKLLDAGAELILEQAQRNPFASLRVRAVCERAGYSTGAFYTHWADADAFQLALGEYLLSDKPTLEDFDTLSGVLESVRDGEFRVALTKLAFADIDELLKNPDWDATELINVTWARARLREAAVRGYREIDRHTADLYEGLLSAHGREPRPPFTMVQIATLLQGLVEGLALRYKVDPQALNTSQADGVSLYTIGVTALLAVLTRKRGGEGTVEQALDDFFERD